MEKAKTFAIFSKMPNEMEFEKTKCKFNANLLIKQQKFLMEIFRASGAMVIEVPYNPNCFQKSLLIGDCAIVINGTALLCRPHKPTNSLYDIGVVLQKYCWQIVETPNFLNDSEVILETSDIIFTGKEIFVGLRENGTNIQGAIIVGRTFSDIPVTPVVLPKKIPLRCYMSFIRNNIFVVSKCNETKKILKAIENHANFSYKTITVKNKKSVNCLCANGYIIYPQDFPDSKFGMLEGKVHLYDVKMSELIRFGESVSRFCVIFEKLEPRCDSIPLVS